MTKRRMVIVVDDDYRTAHSHDADYAQFISGDVGVTVESVEDIPEPDRVQEFRVRIRTRGANPITRGVVDEVLNGRDSFWLENVTIESVTEVEPQ